MATDQLALLFARLQLAAPEAHTILLAAPRSGLNVTPFATGLADVAKAQGYPSSVIDLASVLSAEQRVAAGGSPLVPQPPLCRLREALVRPSGLTIAYGGGLLDAPETALAVGVVDVVVIVARQGKTTRTDLERARVEIERGGGRLAGALLLR